MYCFTILSALKVFAPINIFISLFSFFLLVWILQYLDRIGQLFFGVPPKQSPSYGGLLGEWSRSHFICSLLWFCSTLVVCVNQRNCTSRQYWCVVRPTPAYLYVQLSLIEGLGLCNTCFSLKKDKHTALYIRLWTRMSECVFCFCYWTEYSIFEIEMSFTLNQKTK